MASFSNFIERFRRVTYSGKYMPEIDGLRFIAVFLVAFLMHLGNCMRDGQLGVEYDATNFFHRTIMEGGYGVSLFFVISGFILALPFAQQKLLNGKKISLKEYYWRRVTRIEPPYIVSMILFLCMRVWVLHYGSFKELLPNFFASVFYVHNIVYHYPSAINGVAWSLEVEIQFYLLAPLLTNIYFIKNNNRRRSILLILIAVCTVLSYRWQTWPPSILDKGCYFLCGILLADWYALRKKENNGTWIALFVILIFICWLFVPAYLSAYLCVLKIFMTLLIFYVAITNDSLKKILSKQIIAVIGGMCYSIYLIHMGIYGIMRHHFFTIKFFDNILLSIVTQCFIAVVLVLGISGIFFLLVEKPTMQRDWYKKLFMKKNAL
jgi:peptidoglycan/LPS O-acetylase OafA/YrhL